MPPSPGRLLYSTTEAPNRSDAVEFPASDQPSRPGPAFGSREGVFQASATGEYTPVTLCLPFCPEISPPRSTTAGPSNIPSRRCQTTALDQLVIYYENAGGMNTFVDDYLLACSDNPYGIIIVNETWLNDRTLSHQVFGPGYEVFRCDRSTLTSSKSSGGGVAIAVRRGTAKSITHLRNQSWDCLEKIWLVLDLGNHKLFLCTLYLPPDRTCDTKLFEAHAESVASVTSSAGPEDDVLIFGDLNFDKLRWVHSRDGFLYPDPRHKPESANVTDLLDVYSTVTLRQINCFPNESNNTLDLCFVSMKDVAPVISIAPAPLVKNVPHHVPLLLTSVGHGHRTCMPTSEPVRYDFYKANISSIAEILSSIDWVNILHTEDVNSAVLTFSHILSYAIDRHVPKKPAPAADRIPWQTDELKKLKTKKKAALRKYCKNRTLTLRDHYVRLNQRYKNLNHRCHNNYQLRIQRKLKSNPKTFWKHFNDQRRESGLPSTMILGDDTGSNPDDICRMFASKFSSMYVQESLSPQAVSVAAENVPFHGNNMSHLVLDEADILTAAAKLKSSTNAGPDGIPSLLLKKCIDNWTIPL